jgi:hypothetical protein
LLSAGAAQSGRPTAIVFVATVGGVRQAFQGWAQPVEIVRGLIAASPNFGSAYESAMATAKQWELAFPSSTATLPWRGDEFDNNSKTAFHDQRRNELALAEFLASSISEPSDKPDHISVVRLATLFTPFLRKASLDESERGDAWVSTVLGTTDPYLAITRQGRYVRLIPREAAVNDIISTLIGRAS